MTKTTGSESTQERILRVAAELFVLHGFKRTSIRSICEYAGVNVSMVNYYFHSKEELYLAVLAYARKLEIRRTPYDAEAPRKASAAAEMLRAAIEDFLGSLLLPGPASMLAKLIVRELVEPSSAMQIIVDEEVRPQHEYFARLIRAITGDTLTGKQVRKCIFSIIGQALIYVHNRPINELIAPEIEYDERGVRQLAAHIHEFTMAALTHYQKHPAR